MAQDVERVIGSPDPLVDTSEHPWARHLTPYCSCCLAITCKCHLVSLCGHLISKFQVVLEQKLYSVDMSSNPSMLTAR